MQIIHWIKHFYQPKDTSFDNEMYSELKALYILYEIKIKPTIYKSDPHLCKYSNRDTLNGRGATVKIGTRRPKAAQELARQECDRDE